MKKIITMILCFGILINLFDMAAGACDSDLTYKLSVPSLMDMSIAVYGNNTVYNEKGVNISDAVKKGILQTSFIRMPSARQRAR